MPSVRSDEISRRACAPDDAPAVGFVSLGCPKASVDAERILTRLRADGYRIVDTYQGAQLVIVNTCGFIEAAVNESLQAIGEAVERNGRVIVTGCLGANRTVIEQAHPKVLAVTGPHDEDRVMAHVREHLAPPASPPAEPLPPQGIRLTPRHYAYLKISEGCNHRCSFCIIPSLRGPLISRPVGDVMREAEQLVRAGARELIVISQDSGAYGMESRIRTDFRGGRPVRRRLVELARELGTLGAWIRLHYVYPYSHVDALVELMAEGVVLPYLDVPFQHASRRILRLMKRPASGEDNLARVRAWRSMVPDLTLCSSFITGFPGETGDDFAQLLAFIEQAELDRVGCFTYSPVAGAAANAFPGAVPAQLAEERRARLMQVQERISAQRLARRVGSMIRVLIDEIVPDGARARSAGDAPEIDGVVHVEGRGRLRVGDLADVRVVRAGTHDLWARTGRGREPAMRATGPAT